MVRALSSNRIPPVSQNQSFESFRIRSNSSASSCEDFPHSPFRPRSFSNTSSASQTSPIHLPELTIQNLNHLIGNNAVETDLDDIMLDDLHLGSAQNIPDSATIIREYLNPGEHETHEKYLENPSITVCNSFSNYIF